MKTSQTFTLEMVKEKLKENQQWVEKAIVRLYDFQTNDEQRIQGTKHVNGVGFNSCDARTLSYYANYIKSGRALTGKHLEKAHKIVPKYAKQILRIIENN